MVTLAIKEALQAAGCGCVWRPVEHEQTFAVPAEVRRWVSWEIRTWADNCPLVVASEDGQTKTHQLRV